MFEELVAEEGLSIERLYALVQLSDAGSLIRAANEDPGRQSRYSHYLRELSEFFGVELTVRAGRSIRLTPAGQRLVQLTREHFQELLQFRREVRNEAQEFRLGASDGLIQGLVIPAIGPFRLLGRSFRLVLQSLRTVDVIARVQEQLLDFGLARADAIPAGLKSAQVCTVKYALIVPERLIAQRGLVTLKKALLDCPHAALSSDGQMTQRIQEIAHQLQGQFRPELVCDSLASCVVAVRSGFYAAVLPVMSWTENLGVRCHVVEDALLDALDRRVRLVWHPRLVEVRGDAAKRARDMLTSILQSSDNAAG